MLLDFSRIKSVFIFIFVLFTFYFGSCSKEDIKQDLSPLASFSKEISEISRTYYKGDIKQNYKNYDNFYQGDFSIVQAGPKGKVQDFSLDQFIYLVFSKPVVADKEIGSSFSKHKNISFEPNLKGKFRWYGNSCLLFEPENGLFDDGKYQVTVNKNIKSLSGETLKNNYSFKFIPREFEISDFWTGSSDSFLNKSNRKRDSLSIKQLSRVYIETSYPISAKHLHSRLEIKSGVDLFKYKIFQVKSNLEGSGSAIFRIKLKESLKEGLKLNLYLDDFPLAGREILIRKKFQFLNVVHDFDSNRLYKFPKKPTIKFTKFLFSAQPLFKSLKGRIIFNDRLIPLNELLIRGKFILYIGPINSGSKINNIKILSGIEDLDGRKISQNSEYSFNFDLQTSYIYSPYKPINYIAKNENIELSLETRGIENGHWEIYPLDNYFSQKDRESFKLPFEIKDNFYPANAIVPLSPSLKSGEIGSCFMGKLSVSDEYSKLISPGAMNIKMFQLTDLSITALIFQNQLVISVVNIKNSEVVPHVDVTLYKNKKVFSTLATDEQGIVKFKFNLFDFEYNELLIEVVSSMDSIVFKPQLAISQLLSRDINTKNSAFLQLEKNLYKAGEKVFVAVVDMTYSKGEYKPHKGNFSIHLERLAPYPHKYYSVSGSSHSSGLNYLGYQLPAFLPSGKYLIKYLSKNSLAETIIDIEGMGAISNLFTDRKKYISGDRIQVEFHSYDENSEAIVNKKSFLTMNKTFLNIDKDLLPWENGYIGPCLNNEYSPESNKAVFSDSNGDSSFILDSTELYKSGLYLPCLVEFSPRILNNKKMVAGASKQVIISPSEYYIAARIKSEELIPLVRQNRNFKIEYMLISSDGLTSIPSNFKDGLTLEISPLSKDGIRLKNVKNSTKMGHSSKGIFKIKLKKSGRYLATLQSSDNRGNPIITEIPFFVKGEKDGNVTDYIYLNPLKELFLTSESAKIFVNIPKSLNLDRGSQFMIVKEQRGSESIWMEETFYGSKVIEIPITRSDAPGVKIYLIIWDSLQKKNASLGSDIRYKTIIASCELRVKNLDLDSPRVILNGLENTSPGESVSVDVIFGESGDGYSGRILAYISMQEDFKVDTTFDVSRHFQENSKIHSFVSFADSRMYTNYGDVNFSGLNSKYKSANKLFLNKKNVEFSSLSTFYSGISKKIIIKAPKKQGRYQLLLSGVWNNRPYFSSFPLIVGGNLQAEIYMPDLITSRDLSSGTISISDVSMYSRSSLVKVSIEVIDAKSKLPTDGIRLSRDYFEINKKTNWKSDFFFSAKQLGNYILKFNLERGDESTIIEKFISVDEIDENLNYSIIIDNDNLKSPLFPLNLPIKDPVGIELNIVAGLKKDLIYSKLITKLIEGENDTQLATSSFSYLPWYLLRGSSRRFLSGYSMSNFSANNRIRDLSSFQHNDGGYPFYIDRNFGSDYFSTVRLAEILQLSNVDYFNYSNIWRLTQYLKLAFKGDNSELQSHYVRCYSAYVLAGFDENIILTAKNLLEENDGSIAELSLAAMALLRASKVHHSDVSSYLKEPMLRVIRRFDPNLKDIPTSLEDTIDAKKGSYGYNRPQNQAVECALAYLLFDMVGGHLEEADNAMKQMLESDFSIINSFDASFCLRALIKAEKRGFFTKNGSTSNILNGLTTMNLGDSSIASIKWSGTDLSLYKNSFKEFQSESRDSKYSLNIEGSDSFSANYSFDFTIPVESIGADSHGYSAFSEIRDLDGNIVSLTSLIPGKIYQYRLVVSSSSGDGPVTVMIPFPRVANIGIDSVKILSSDGFGLKDKRNNIYLGVKKSRLKDGILISYDRFLLKFDEIVINFKAEYPGIYLFSPAKIENLYDSRLFANTNGEIIVVKPFQ